jgi:hypothetical protein
LHKDTLEDWLSDTSTSKVPRDLRSGHACGVAQQQQKTGMQKQSIQNDNYENTVSTEGSDEGEKTEESDEG